MPMSFTGGFYRCDACDRIEWPLRQNLSQLMSFALLAVSGVLWKKRKAYSLGIQNSNWLMG